MNLLQNLQNMLDQGLSGVSGSKDGNNLSGLLGPAALGGLAGLLLTSKAARGTAAGALLAGGGALLWNKYKDRISAPGNAPEYGRLDSPPDRRAERLIRAMVFAAKSDGHIDDREQQAIREKMQSLNLGPEAEEIVQRAMQEPLDPASIARDVGNAGEALELYTFTCAVIDPDHFMERSYLEALGDALHIPADIRAELAAKPGA